MEVAIALLVTVAIVSVIGTVIQQNQPYIDYSIKFGPFWFEILRWLGMYDIYSQLWFLSTLAFLTLSTCSCVLRNIRPTLLEWRRQNSLNMEQQIHDSSIKQSLSLQVNAAQWQQLKQQVQQRLGLRLKPAPASDNHWRAVKSNYAKLGYFLTHIGVIVICLGAVADSSVMLKWQEWRGELSHETRNINLTEIPDSAWLETSNANFRGSVSIPEGQSANVVFLPWKDGYLVQKLPFFVHLMDFRTEHYSTGQPKSFESDLAVYDLQKQLITTRTIAVNQPLTIDGITIYQSSFEDGGSILDLSLTNLLVNQQSTLRLSVSDNTTIHTFATPISLELTDFRPFNIQPLENQPNKFKNQGPSFNYKIRNASGQAVEYNNYLLPVEKEGRWFYLSGIRKTPAEPFRFLHIPADDNQSKKTFMQLLARLNNTQQTQQDLQHASFLQNHPQFQQGNFLSTLLQSFAQNGLSPIEEYIKNMAPEAQSTFRQTLLELLHLSFAVVYETMLSEQQDPLIPVDINEQKIHFIQDAFTAINALSVYEYPLLLQLNNYRLIQASGLQMTRSSAKQWVYLGCLMLIIGIFIMLYLPKKILLINRQPQKLTIALQHSKNNDFAKRDLQAVVAIIEELSR